MGIDAELPGQPQRRKLNFKTLPIHSQVIRDKAIKGQIKANAIFFIFIISNYGNPMAIKFLALRCKRISLGVLKKGTPSKNRVMIEAWN